MPIGRRTGMKNECDKCLWFVHIPSVEDTERNPSLLEYPYKVIDNRICALGGCQNGNRFEERNKGEIIYYFFYHLP